MRADQTQSAQAMADELEQLFGSPGWKILWNFYKAELRNAELSVIHCGTNGRDGGNPSRVALNLRYYQGVLYGIKSLERWPTDLLKALKSGVIPGRRTSQRWQGD